MLTRFPRRTDARLFLALALAASVLSLVAVAGSLGYVGRTFPGFIVWDNLLVVALGRPGWTGVEAGVPFRGRLTHVDGEVVHDRAQVEHLVGATPAGTVHRYAFTSRARHTTVPAASAVSPAGAAPTDARPPMTPSSPAACISAPSCYTARIPPSCQRLAVDASRLCGVA